LNRPVRSVRPFAAATLALVGLTSLVAAWPGGESLGADGVGRLTANAALIERMVVERGLSAEQRARVEAIFAGSSWLGQGNPAVTHHPMTEETCRAREAAAGMRLGDIASASICGGPHMAPLYDPATQRETDATACIDRFEYPDLPCAYPVVWVRASEAAALCQAEGKRLCDAHEWEGACEGALQPPDYRFDLARGVSTSGAVGRMRSAHNAANPQHRWSYGPAYREGVCGTNSTKTPGCNGGDWRGCGSNTYPAGAFPDCHSALDVYDLNGNAAEQMNLPLRPDQLSSASSTTLGVTEMKGSWFIFDKYKAHEDWCRWRAPFWHGSAVLDPDSHRNYHLGFRCCKTVAAQEVDGLVYQP
jgi:hypothetical protein